MGEMNKNKYKCKYCGKEMSKFDYETYNGYCGKCREVMDWKKVLGDLKEYKNE